MKKRLVQNLALIALAIGVLVAIHALSGTTEVQAARGGGNCPAVSNGLPGVKSEAGGEDSMSCHLDEGVVAEICIKAGNTNSNCANTNACYTTSGIGTAWGTATRTGSGPGCKGISNIVCYVGPEPTPEPTPAPGA